MIDITANEVEHKLASREELEILFIHTPLCGTCKRAASMLEILEMTYDQLSIDRLNINHHPSFAHTWRIKSVPCLMVFQKGLGVERVYAFQSIPALHALLQPYLKDKSNVLTLRGE
ncbi:thioredoxin family protein [Alkalicoccobacillus murimartini]|uniref:Thioredoxin-like negative regulator of GroEL n=1 Tax=Alkalicoccobacillus murimartini TaxID=171685 RepID=A0ABT9YE24_9BACI|nr:thioredoxin family protein [Alkalicoccobacillus murimartini]MDQ0205974.1 thioredoxin-like negative regulator of GroEL [Alkalicoccobacillus murimartini]